MPDHPTRRCFIAIPLDGAAAEDLNHFTASLDLPGLRPTRRENLHLTLKFLGNVEVPRLPDVIEELHRAVEGTGPFELNINAAAIRPNRRRPRLLAATLDCPDRLSRLHEGIEAAMETCGIRRDRRAFHPHITLGRFRRSRRREAKDGSPPPPEPNDLNPPQTRWRADRVVLTQSDLTPAGPTYTPLAQFPLNQTQ